MNCVHNKYIYNIFIASFSFIMSKLSYALSTAQMKFLDCKKKIIRKYIKNVFKTVKRQTLKELLDWIWIKISFVCDLINFINFQHLICSFSERIGLVRHNKYSLLNFLLIISHRLHTVLKPLYDVDTVHQSLYKLCLL